MTLQPRDLRPIPADIAELGQQLLAPDNPYRVLGDRLAELMDETAFAPLYEERGRPALSPVLLALVTLFQHLEDLPDRAAAAQVVVRLDWKYALHLPLRDAGFHYSCLCHFRQRLLAHQEERLVFEEVLRTVRTLGFLKKHATQRTDALAVLGAVRQLSALELVHETLRLALRALRETDPAWVARAVPTSLVEVYAQGRSDYRLSASERQEALVAVGHDGLWLLGQLESTAPAEVAALPAVETLRAVWAQHFERAADGGVQERARPVPCTELIVTPHDVGVRAGEKRGTKWRGEKVHITETAEKGAINFITDVTTANASSGDGEALPQIRAQLAQRALLPTEQVVDAGYVSGKQLAQSAADGVELVGPPLEDTSPNGFKIADFTLDHATRVATCPQGHTARKWTERTDRDGSRALNIQFPAATCAACPLRAQCTTSKGGRSLHVSAHYPLVQARRAEAQTAAFRERLRARPAIEGTLSELVRAHGLRRHRYRGEAPRVLENLLKAAACNLKRLVRALLTRAAQSAGAQP